MCICTSTKAFLRIMSSERRPPASVKEPRLAIPIRIDHEEDGRWIAEIPEVPGALAYGATQDEAKARAYARAFYAVADDVEKSSEIPETISVQSVSA
jgi:predicted RNase H-like HicB family nuclease